MSPEWTAGEFIGEEVQVTFDQAPLLTKKPEAPRAFVWRGDQLRVREVAAAWFDYRRRGNASRNMTPEHAEAAAGRGSWGVGRFYFRVVIQDGRAFDLYYDRAPRSASDRAGHWILWRELRPSHT
jgi:hypothetical protein